MRRMLTAILVGALVLALTAGIATARDGGVSPQAEETQCNGGECRGSNRQDTIRGTCPGQNLFDGDDTIFALAGPDDVIVDTCTGDVDTVFGGKGNDTIASDDGDTLDEIDCGPGKRDSAVITEGDEVRNCENVFEREPVTPAA